jgi:hypothetical protein
MEDRELVADPSSTQQQLQKLSFHNDKRIESAIEQLRVALDDHPLPGDIKLARTALHKLSYWNTIKEQLSTRLPST